jgi:hypothetical protein
MTATLAIAHTTRTRGSLQDATPIPESNTYGRDARRSNG